MRFNAGHAEVQAEGFSQQVSGSILASGKAFKGLIDGLYSRKIEAIVRELSTNAFDAHKLAAYIGPFSVHLPSALDPVFWIRDFGPGMSDEFMLNRYPVLFDSTKDGLNEADRDVIPEEQVGCLGLGRMSFFAYTDACTVTVWQHGEMRVYAVFMGGDGVIQIALAGSMPSDEPTGVKVEFAVKTKDFQQFREAAIRVYKGFSNQPQGLPVEVQNAVSVEPAMVGSFWKSFPEGYLPGGGFYARQGCVLYPIDLVQVDSKAVEDDDGNLTLSGNFARFAGNKNTVVLDFPIGSIGFDLSRERLSYDDQTVLALRNRWQEFTDDLNSLVKKEFASLSNSHERMRAAMTGAVREFGALFGCSKESIEAEATLDAIWNEFPRYQSEAVAGEHAILHAISKPSASLHVTPEHYRHRQQWKAPHRSEFVEAVFVYRDEVKAQEKARIGHWMYENNIELVLVIRPTFLTLKQFRKWGCPAITRLSDIPKLPKMPKLASGGGGGGGVFDRFKFPCDTGFGLRSATSDVSEISMDDRYFALMNKGEFVPTDKSVDWMDTCDVQMLHRLMKRFRGIDITFINTRINEPDDKWDEYPKFYHLLDGLVESIPPAYIKRIIAALNRDRFVGSWYSGAVNAWRIANPRSDDPISGLYRFQQRFDNLGTHDLSLMLQFLGKCGIGIDHGLTKKPFWSELLNQIIERARGMGLEVLPPMSNRGHEDTKPRLLPKRWEKIAKIVKYPHNNHGQFYRLLLKETSSTC